MGSAMMRCASTPLVLQISVLLVILKEELYVQLTQGVTDTS